MSEPVISVVIPVYNVEPYLRRCLDSVAGQTCKDLEILLVDDGSTDGSGAVCDEYAARDGRFRVIHKENGGLSSARNAALAAATGRWIGFVDSDDWIEPDMYASLLSAATDARADIAVCGQMRVYKRRRILHEWPDVQVFSTDAALEQLLRNDRMQNSVCDKLFRRRLYEQIRFPETRTYEDMAVMHRLFCEAKTVVCIPGVKYHYEQRHGSVTEDISIKNRVNHYLSAKERYDQLQERYPQYQELMAEQCIASAISVWSVYQSNPKAVRNKYRAQIEEMAAFAREHRAMRGRTGLGAAGKVMMRLVPHTAYWSFALANLCARAYRLVNGQML